MQVFLQLACNFTRLIIVIQALKHCCIFFQIKKEPSSKENDGGLQFSGTAHFIHLTILVNLSTLGVWERLGPWERYGNML
jgi:hypothetical protein